MSGSLAEKIMHQLNYSFNLIRRERHGPGMRGGGVRRGQGQLLNILLKQETATQTELAEMMRVRPASVGELVYKLERKGYVERSQNAADKRRIDVALTALGRNKALEIADSRLHLAEDVFSGLSIAEQEQFASLLDKFVATLEAHHNRDSLLPDDVRERLGRCLGEGPDDIFGDTGPRCKDACEHDGDMGFDWQK